MSRQMPEVEDAALVLGNLVAAARRRRGLSAQELARLVGVSLPTLRKVEHGDASVALGTAFQAAAIVGVQLFGTEAAELRGLVKGTGDSLALLPARVQFTPVEVDNDF